jgi:hypothetical protein
MFKLDTFLQILPKIATHPLAILAYICVAGVWLLAFFRWRKSNDFLKALELLPKAGRADFARKSGYKYDELASLPQKQRLKLLTQRYWLIAFIVTILAVIFLGIAITVVYKNNYSELKIAFDKLKKKSDETDNSIAAFRIKVEAVRAASDTAGRLLDNPELKREGEELRKAADEFDARYHSQLTADMVLEVRLIRALAANAEGNYQEAQNLVSDDDLEAHTLRFANMLLIRADASFGLGQSSKAIVYYQKLLGIIPTSLRGLLGVADCEVDLGQYKEAIRIYNNLVEVANQSTSSLKLAILSKSLNDRGLAFQKLKQFSNAIADYSQAIEIARQSKPNDEYGLNANEWALLSNRGRLYCEFNQVSNALADHNLALKLSRTLGNDGIDNTDLRSALLLNNRCLDYIGLEQYSNAVADINKAINIWEPLANNGNPSFSNLLAAALMNRGIAYRDLGYISNSLNDFNQGIKIWRQLIQDERGQLAVNLAKGLFNRADAYEDDHKFDVAIADHDESLVILEKLSSEGHPELADIVASELSQRGFAYLQLANIEVALNNYNQAVTIYDILIDRQRWDIADDFAGALLNRGLAHSKLNQETNALDDYNRSMELSDAFFKHGYPNPTDKLPTLLIDRASTYNKLHQATNAIADCAKAVTILEPQVKNKPDLYKLLKMAFIVEGNAFDQIGQLTNAIEDYIQSYNVSQTMAANGLPAMDDFLEKALFNCANDYKRIGQLTNCIIYYNHAMSVVKLLITNTPELKTDLAKILKGRGIAFCAEGDITNAINDFKAYEEVITDKVEMKQCYLMLGIMLWIDDKKETTKTYLENLIKLNSDQKTTTFANQFLSEMQTNKDAPQMRKKLMDTLQKTLR